MYKGFNLTLTEDYFSTWHSKGKSLHRGNKSHVEGSLNNYFDNDGSLSATKIAESWFPNITSDVFISHSHADSTLAIGMAGWLEENFGLRAFIDSTVWGYSEKLLKKLDNRYCLNKSRETYNYDKRNKTTSHVNIILSTALHNMIDASECVIFLNTPSSVTCEGYVTEEATHSPWIYSEISMTRLIKRKSNRPSNFIRKAEASLEAIAEDVSIKYDLPLSHLISITSDDLTKWENSVYLTGGRGVDTLDNLYQMFPRG